MRHHFLYAAYLVRHKWYVALACFRMGLYWRGLVHDISKFYLSEWIPYANHFYGSGSDPTKYNVAWLKHIHRNSHHWEHWVIPQSDNKSTSYNIYKPTSHVVEMPANDIQEMLCDWYGAARAQKSSHTVTDWFMSNKHKLILHPTTAKKLISYLSTIKWLRENV